MSLSEPAALSGSQEAATVLREAIGDSLRPVAAAINALRQAQVGMSRVEDLVEVMQAATAVVLACDAAHHFAKQAEQDIRQALAEAMATGATTFHTEQHTVSLRAASRKVVVTDAALLPPRFMVQPPTPPPAPDLSAIAFQLRNGEAVPGAQLNNGGAPTVVIRNRS